MNGQELEKLLAQVPLSVRAEAREFARMSPEAQRIFLYSSMSELQNDVRRLTKRADIKTALASAGYSTLLVAGTIAALVTGRVPTP